MIAHLKPYPEFKDSGFPWLGKLPAHWATRRAKYLFREIDERSQTGKEVLLSVSHLTGVTPRSEKNITMFLAKSNVGHKLVKPNDVVINTLWAWMAALGVTRHVGLVSPAYGVYRPSTAGQLLPSFVDQLLRTPIYAAEYLRRSTGVNSSRMRLYPEQFLEIPLVTPPIDEQVAIVQFLDRTNRRLEKAIRAKRKVIALLNEQKQAIIHRAVTRGLDPTVPLKPSGIPWLGDIPQHWQSMKLKRLGTVRIGLIYSPGDMVGEAGTVVLRASNIRNGMIVSADNVYVSKKIPDHLIVKEDDILICVRSGSRGLVGKSALITSEWAGVSYGAFMSLFRGNNSKFIFWVLNSNLFPSLMAQFETSTINQLTQNDLRNLDIPIPPTEERSAIANYLREATDRFNDSIRRLESEILLLREYRTRLVADVVTGKLDVREAARNLPDEAELPGTPDADAEDVDAIESEDESTEVEA